MKILVFTTDVPPIAGLPTSGTALRTDGFIRGLRACGHEVFVSVPRLALDACLRSSAVQNLSADGKQQLDDLRHLAFIPETQMDLIAEVVPDIVLCGHWPAVGMKLKPSQLLIVDLAGPHLLERHYQGAGEHQAATMGKLAACGSADYFIVSGPSQRLYFLSFLTRAGVENPTKRILTIPMPLSPQTPEREIQPQSHFFDGTYPRIIFGGVFLPWQDPSWALKAVGAELYRMETGILELIGGKHPHYDVDSGKYEELYSSLEHHPRVRVSPLLPYDEFQSRMSRADVALSLMDWNLERQLAVTIRSTTYLWSGLPLIYDDYSDISALLKKYDAGWCIRPGDEIALRECIEEIVRSPELVREKGKRATQLARECFSWDKAIAPLIDAMEFGKPQIGRTIDFWVHASERADLRLAKESSITQYFTARKPGLTSLEFRLALHGGLSEETTLEARLFEKTEEDSSLNPALSVEVASTGFSVSNVLDNEWIAFEFEPQQNSAGCTYCLQLTLAEGSAAPLNFWTTRDVTYPALSLYIDRVRLENEALCMRAIAEEQV